MEKIEKEYFAYVDGANLKEDVDTRIITSRIKNHRLKGYLNHHGGEERVKSTWNKTTKVDILIGPHNDIKIMLKASGHNNDLTMDIGDFFAMFSIPDINKGFSRFQRMGFRLNSDSDIRRLVNFFERVSVDGKLIGEDHNIPPIVEIVSTKVSQNENTDRPREISKREKSVLDYITKNHNTRWNSANPNTDQYASPSNKDRVSATDVNNRDIWKR